MEGTCKRGHAVLNKAQESYYDTVTAQNCVDGRLHTFQSMQEHQSKLKQWSAQPLAESVEFIACLEDDGKIL